MNELHNAEKFFRELQDFLSKQNIHSEEQLQELSEQFFEEYNARPKSQVTEENARTAEDYIELAEESNKKKDKARFLKKALEIDQNNIEASMQLIDLLATDENQHLKELKNLLEESREHLQKKFSKFEETDELKPLIKLYDDYIGRLISLGKMSLAAKSGEEMLQLFDEDVLGMRYILMHLYAHLENEPAALNLLSRYDDKTLMFYLPLSVLYYKMDQEEKSLEYLRKLVEMNKDTRRFFASFGTKKMEDLASEIMPFGAYQLNTMSEYMVCMMAHRYLYEENVSYMLWAKNIVKDMKKVSKRVQSILDNE